MRFYPMAGGSDGTVTVPQLSGGLNLHDLPELVGDNQLTEADNVWWHRGALRTRPGMACIGRLPDGYRHQVQSLNEREALVYHFPYGDFADGGQFFATVVHADGSCETIGSPQNGAVFSRIDDTLPHVIGVRVDSHRGYDWCFYVEGNGVYTYTAATATWQCDRDTLEPYVPLILINGRGNKAPEGDYSLSPEAPNLLTNRVRCTFTTDGVSDLYTMPMGNVAPYRATLTVYSGESSRTVEGLIDVSYGTILFPKLSTSEAGLTDSGEVDIRCCIDPNSGVMHTTAYPTGTMTNPIKNFVLPAAYTATAGNLKLWLYTGPDPVRENPIDRMRTALWYGGLQASAETGIHLFTAGDPQEPNRLCWSEVNDPTYFPKNNYAYVGENASPITRLAKQGDMLVIFREHDIYCTRYTAGEVPTQEELLQQSALETNVYKAYFPLSQLHPNIGCDCPHTVQLVNNRLVWLTSDGRVHILTASSPYSERNVRQASPLIEQALRAHSKEELQQAVAGELEGYYLLLIGRKAYLLDCQTAAFTSFQYYSREETAQKALPWYVWTLPRSYDGVVYDGDGLVLVGKDALYAPEGDTDEGAAVHARLATKYYAPGRQNKLLHLSRLTLETEDVAGCRLQLTYLTDRDLQAGGTVTCDGARRGRLRGYTLPLHLRQVRRFALRVEADRPMALTGMTLTYTQQGGNR